MIHFNTEYIKGFIDGLFEEYEISLGPIKSELQDFEIETRINIKEKFCVVYINYAIISDSELYATKFVVEYYHTKEQFRSIVQEAIEQIINSIKSFHKSKN